MPTPVFHRVLALEVGGNHAHLGARRGQVHTWLQPRDDVQEVDRPERALLGREGHRDPELHLAIAKRERRRHHPDHRRRGVVHRQLPPDDCGIARVATLPERVADDDDGGILPVFVLGERAPEQRLHTEHAEKAGGDAAAEHALGQAAAGEVRARRPRGRHVLEDAVAGLPIDVVPGRRRVLRESGEARIFPDHDQPVGLAVRQRPQQHGIHRRDDGGGGADAECEREQRDEHDAAIAQRRADGDADVLQQRLEPGSAVRLVEALARRSDIAECPPAMRRASSGDAPSAMSCSVSMAICASISRLKSLSRRLKRPHALPPGTRGGAPSSLRGSENSFDRERQAAPLRLARGQLLTAPAVERIEAGAAVVVGDTPLGVDPPPRLEPLQRRVQRAVVDE